MISQQHFSLISMHKYEAIKYGNHYAKINIAFFYLRNYHLKQKIRTMADFKLQFKTINKRP